MITDHIEAKVEIKNGSSEKIDIIDFDNQTTYELKVSGNNVHHEFYKDIFKVLAYKNNYPVRKIKQPVFVLEKYGIDTLENSILCEEIVTLFKNLIGSQTLDIDLVRIETEY